MIFDTEPGAYSLTVFQGLSGYLYVCDDGTISVPFIESRTPGQGYCRAFLEELPRNRPIIFPCVLSERLEGMLKRKDHLKTLAAFPILKKPLADFNPEQRLSLFQRLIELHDPAPTVEDPAFS